MKFTKYNIIQAIKNHQVTSILIYGPDQGMVSLLSKQIAKTMNQEKDSYDYEELSHQDLISLFCIQDLFGNLVEIRNVPNSIPKDLKAILLGSRSKFIILIAEELSKSSSMRKFFESEDKLAIVPCYIDEPAVIAKRVRSYIESKGYRITPEALLLFSHTISRDSLSMQNEIDKLLLYLHNPDSEITKLITRDDIKAITAFDTESAVDKLCSAFTRNDITQYEFYDKHAENIVWVIRALIRYNINLLYVHKKMAHGIKIDEALSLVTPPIFFKSDFQKDVIITTQDKVSKNLQILYKTNFK